jgi:hypothetical protein
MGQAARGGSWSGSASAAGGVSSAMGLELHVAVLELPLVILLEQDSADQADDRRLVMKDPDAAKAS